MNKLVHFICIAVWVILWSMPTQLNAFTCYDAEILDCDRSYWFQAPTHDHLNRINYNLWDCGASPWSYDGKDHLYQIDVGTYPRDLRITLTGLSDNLDLFVFKRCKNHYNAITLDECRGMSIRPWTLDDEVLVSGAQGIYYLVVDGPNHHNSSDYKIEVSCEDEPDLCARVPEISCGQKVYGGDWNYGDHVTDIIDYHDACHYWNKKYDGPEHIYKLSGHYQSLHNITIDLYSHGYHTDHDLFLYTRCESFKDQHGKIHYSFSGQLDYCHNQHEAYSNHESAFVQHLGSHKELYIVVEGRPDHYGHYSKGDFELIVSCGDPCDQKEYKLECNTEISGSTLGRKNKASNYACGYYDDKGHNWGPEITYYFDIEEETDIEIELEPDSYTDLNLYLLSGCSTRSCLAYCKHKGKGVAETIRQTLWPGRYYVVVEGYRGDAGHFDLRLSGCACHNSEDLYCDEAVYGNTYGGTQIVNELKDECFDLSSSPVNISGPENIYVFKAMESRMYTFQLSELTKNLDLYLIDNCNDVNSCRGFSTKSGTNNESISMYMHAYEEILVLVDSWSDLLTSSYRLEVVCTPEEEEGDPDDEEGDYEMDDEGGDDEETVCFTASQSDLREILLDLSGVVEEADTGAITTLLVYPLVDGQKDSSAVETVAITGQSASYTVPNAGEVQYFVFCFEKISGDVVTRCCLETAVDPVLGCGMTFSGTTIGGNSEFGKADIELCYSSSSKFDGPDYLVPFQKDDGDAVISVTLFQNTDNLSLFILDQDLQPVRSPCKGQNFNVTKTLGNKSSVGEVFTDGEDPLPAGTYYALIEGFAKTIADDFTLSVACGSGCEEAVELTCGETVDGTLDDTPNLLDCYEVNGEKQYGYTASERWYRFNLESETEIEIALDEVVGATEAVGELGLFLFEGLCANGVPSASTNVKTGQAGSISALLAAGEYSIAVDGWRHATAAYSLSVLGCDAGALAPPISASARSSSTGEKTISVWPNPFRDQVRLTWKTGSEEAQLEAFQSDGRLIWRGQVRDGMFTLGTDQLGDYTGVLYYRIRIGDDIHTGTLVRMP